MVNANSKNTKTSLKNTNLSQSLNKSGYVRLDMNIIKYPIFNHSKRKKKNESYKYFFNKEKTSYLEVIPRDEDCIPGSIEEILFLSIMKIFDKKAQPKEFFFTIKNLIEELEGYIKDLNKNYCKIKEALLRLSETEYKFRNSMYSNIDKKILKGIIVTKLFDLDIIYMETNKDKELVNKLTEKFGKKYKEIYKIKFNENFYHNLIKKGNLTYSYELLFKIKDSLSRKLYIYLEKERHNNLFYEEELEFFINKIPLSCCGKNFYKLIPILKSKIDNLVELGFIKKFSIIEKSPRKKSILKFEFNENFNKFKEEVLLYSVNSKKELKEVIDEIIDEGFKIIKNPLSENVDKVMKILPIKIKNIKNIKNIVQKSISLYGIQKTLQIAYKSNVLSKTDNGVKLITEFKRDCKEVFYEQKNKLEINKPGRRD